MATELKVLGKEKILGEEFTIYGTKENPLFLAKDIAGRIKHSNITVMLGSVDEDERVKIRPKHSLGLLTNNNEYNFLTEYGMYECLMQSRKPIAKQFKKEIKTILKSIRLDGGYISVDATEEQVEKLIENYSMRSITKKIHKCDVMELEKLVNEIIETNTSSGKRNRVDSRLKKLNATEYKQHIRKHIRKAIETKPYSKDIKIHSVEIAIRDRIIIALTDDVLATTNRKYGQLV
ncbi:MAG: BRO family protein [Vallitalea sp.]|jgi:prophage antirepressor-like protein|nr:BRO family protein [Vallitalea sp.]